MVRVGLLSVSDGAASGNYEDRTGPAVRNLVESWPSTEVVYSKVIADDRSEIAQQLRGWATEVDLILTNGGTGLDRADLTPDATLDVVERQVPGIVELMRAETGKSDRFAALSRAVAGQLDNCLIVNLPGSPDAATEALEAIADVVHRAASR